MNDGPSKTRPKRPISKKAAPSSRTLLEKSALADPFKIRIKEEVEEFLRDLTLEFPFSEIFESLKRHEFNNRFGKNVTPLPKKKFSVAALKELHERIDHFLLALRKHFGSRYANFIEESFREYTATTLETPEEISEEISEETSDDPSKST